MLNILKRFFFKNLLVSDSSVSAYFEDTILADMNPALSK